MATYNRVNLSIDDAAAFLRVKPVTIRNRLAAGELHASRSTSGTLVRFSPHDDWLRAEDAGALLGVSATTVRAAVRDGRLAGRREDGGRWRVQLASVLDDRRCDREAVELFGGTVEARPSVPPPRPRRGRSRRDVFVRLDDEHVEVLERGVDRHGTIKAAVVAGLHAIDDDQVSSSDAAELRTERDLYEQQLERVRVAHRGLSARAARHHVDELYCPRCEEHVSLLQDGVVDQVPQPDGTVELYCTKHRRRGGGYRGAPLARRAPIELDASA